MKKIILVSFLFASIVLGCKKENNNPQNGNSSNNQITTGTLYFKNTKIDPYIIYLDGANIGTLASGSTSSGYVITSGISHTVKSQQSSGYIFVPTVYSGTVTLNPGGYATWSF